MLKTELIFFLLIMFLFFNFIETSRSRDKNLGKHLKSVENMAQKNGLSTEGIDILLNVALSGKFGMSSGCICNQFAISYVFLLLNYIFHQNQSKFFVFTVLIRST